MGLFGPTKKEISWRRFASEVGGTFHYYFPRFYLWDDYHILVRKSPWTINLNTCNDFNGYATHMSAPYISDDDLEFEMVFSSSVHWFERLMNKLGRKKYIEIGYPEFDSEYDIHAYNESKAQELFRNAKIRQLIQSVMSKRNSVLRAEKRREWFTSYWMALSYFENGIITDIGRLKSMLELITGVLNQMREIGLVSPIPLSE